MANSKTAERTALHERAGPPPVPGLHMRPIRKEIARGLYANKTKIDGYATRLLRGGVINNVDVAMVLLDIAHYYDNVEESITGIRISRQVFEYAMGHEDVNLLRRANNVLGISYSKFYDFSRSSHHLQEAVRLGGLQEGCAYELFALSNMVCLLQIMGLEADAKQLCVFLLARPLEQLLASSADQQSELRVVYLQNALNGATNSRATGDIEKAQEFLSICKNSMRNTQRIPVFYQAHYHSLQATIRGDLGDVSSAFATISSAIRKYFESGSQQTKVALAVAEAEIVCLLGDDRLVESSSRRMLELLETPHNRPAFVEDILRALIKLYSVKDDLAARESGEKILSQLTQHLILNKHKQFYDQVRIPAAAGQSDGALLFAPMYPRFLTDGRYFKATTHYPEATAFLSSISKEYVDQSLFLDHVLRAAERPFRSAAYCIAENWAIAGDLKAGGNGRHGAWVGATSRLIAPYVTNLACDAIQLDLAVRLHDIGDIAVNATFLRGARNGWIDDYLILREHANAGAVILSNTDDRTLNLGARIARFHHEFWNGTGPLETKGSEIPLEARICAVANACVEVFTFVAENGGDVCALVKAQLLAMSGVQLDPEIVDATLSGMLRSDGFRVVFDEIQRELSRGEDRGTRAYSLV